MSGYSAKPPFLSTMSPWISFNKETLRQQSITPTITARQIQSIRSDLNSQLGEIHRFKHIEILCDKRSNYQTWTINHCCRVWWIVAGAILIGRRGTLRRFCLGCKSFQRIKKSNLKSKHYKKANGQANSVNKVTKPNAFVSINWLFPPIKNLRRREVCFQSSWKVLVDTKPHETEDFKDFTTLHSPEFTNKVKLVAKTLWSITDPKSTRKHWICTITTNKDHIINPNFSKRCCMMIELHLILIKCLIPLIQTCSQCRWLFDNLWTFGSGLLSSHRHHKLGTNTGLHWHGWRINVGACNCSGISHYHKHKKKKLLSDTLHVSKFHNACNSIQDLRTNFQHWWIWGAR